MAKIKDSDWMQCVVVDSGFITVKKSKVVGKCHFSGHRGYLTPSTVKNHDCLGKNCKYFEQFKNKPYWETVKLEEQQKNLHKEEIKKSKNKKKFEEEQIASLCEQVKIEAQNVIASLQLNLYVVDCMYNKFSIDKHFTIVYVSDIHTFKLNKNTEDRIASYISEKFGKTFKLKAAKQPDGSAVTIEEYRALVANK